MISAWDNGKRAARPMVNEDDCGSSYLHVRGEILGLCKDEPQRRHSSRTCLSIKNESRGIEDDQIPS